MFLGHRSNDPVITLCQDNARQTVEIVELNASACAMLGYALDDLKHLPLKALLPSRVADLVEDYLEYDDASSHDIASVLAKVQNFSVLGKDGREHKCSHKTVRAESFGRVSNFKLVLQPEAESRRQDAFRAVLRENFKGHEVLDAATGLPDRGSLFKDLELVLFYANKGELRACFALIELDGMDALVAKHGQEACSTLMKHVAQQVRGNLRDDDTLGVVSYKRLGLILVDALPDAARMVLNRLRWLISSVDAGALGLSGSITVSISFAKVGGRVNDKLLLQDCEEFLDSLQGRGGNLLIEVGELDKRGKKDRRERSVPVAFDRRTGKDRRDT